MADFKVENFLIPISSDAPCGKSLEHESEFLQLENAAKFIAERQMGEVKIPEAVPDWKKVRDSAIHLLEKSRDIQIAMHLTCALLWTEGFSGFVRGLSLILGLLDNYWEDVHPQKDSGDAYPILRINTLSALNDYKRVLAQIAQIKLTCSRAGEFAWQDIKNSMYKLAPADGSSDSLDPKLIEAAFADTELATLMQQEQDIKQAIELSEGIVALVVEKTDTVHAPDLSPVINLLNKIDKCLTEKIQQRATSEIGSADSPDQSPLEKPSTAFKMNGIQSRDEVIRALDAICNYFEHNEPSSPIPFLMLRAKKLLIMNFMDILREMAPDAVNQAEKICGVHQDR